MAALCHLVFQPLEVPGIDDQYVVGALADIPLLHLVGMLLGIAGTGSLYRLSDYAVMLEDEVLDLIDIDCLIRHCGIERVDGGIFLPLQKVRKDVVRKFQLPVLETAPQQFLALCGLLELLLIEFLLDTVPCLGSDDIVEPVRSRLLILGSHHIDDISRVQLFPEGDGLSVDPRAGAPHSQAGMDVESEIQHRSPGRKNPELSGRSEDKDFLGRRLRKIVRITLMWMFEGIPDRLQPSVQMLFMLDSLVGPMRSGPVLRLIIHPARADLDLDGGPRPVLYGNMQGLVPVWFRIRHPVPKAGGVRLIFFSHV